MPEPTNPPPPTPRPGDPYCSRCGYVLVGLHDSSRCPECGTSFVDGLVRGRSTVRGTRYTSEARLLGMPVISIAFGPHGEESFGTARGFVALGDRARGVIAIGGQSRGIISIGGSATGIVAVGGASVGVISTGGAALGAVAGGGAALAGIANGGAAIGFAASGGAAVGYYARGGGAVGRYVDSPRRTDQQAVDTFIALAPVTGFTGVIPRVIVLQGTLLLVGVLVALVMVAFALRRHARRSGPAGAA